MYYFMSNKKSAVIGRANIGNKPNFNAFDLSHRNLFTTSTGVLRAVQYAELLPGEKFSVSESHFTRAQNLISNSYGRFIESVQSFFVPYSSICREYSMRVLDTAQKTMSGYNENRISNGISQDPSTLSTRLPRLALSDIFRFCLVLDAVCYCISKNPSLHLSESSFYIISNSGLPRSTSIARQLMSLGYGDWTPFFKDSTFALPMISVDSNYVSTEYGFMPSETYHFIDFSDMSKIKDIYASYKYLVSPMRLFAYHKIYNDFYRNDVWQPYSSSTCNLDYLVGSDMTVHIPWHPSSSSDDMFFDKLQKMVSKSYTSVSDIEQQVYNLILTAADGDMLLKHIAFFDERPLNLPLDAVNGVLPSPQYGSASQVSIKSATTANPVQDDTYIAVLSSDKSLYALTSNGDSNGSVSLDFSVKDMRIAQSLQKYKEISAAHQNYFVDQINAHFGVQYTKDPFFTKFLGGQSNVIQVDTQVNTNLAGDNQAVLGGIASAQGQFTCNGVADDYGLLITLHGIYPIVDYPNIAMDTQVLSVDGTDIPIPEFDNNGFEGHRCISSLGNLTKRYVSALEQPLDVYGYSSRYFDYKVSKDIVNGAFLTSLKDKVMGLNTLDDIYLPIIKRTLYASPRMCDQIFANQNHSTIDDDQFYTNMNCGLSVIRPFSVHSLPFAN